MKYWLIKSDPEEFAWEDLKKQSQKKTCWDGVRNYQARNYLREMKKGDLAFFYHSVLQPQSIMGIVTITREAYPDFTQFEKSHPNYDSKSNPDEPSWVMVDVTYKQEIEPPITREEIKKVKSLQEMVLFKNSRLSVQPVSAQEWKTVLNLRSRGKS